jgi:hypothetical protein
LGGGGNEWSLGSSSILGSPYASYIWQWIF